MDDETIRQKILKLDPYRFYTAKDIMTELKKGIAPGSYMVSQQDVNRVLYGSAKYGIQMVQPEGRVQNPPLWKIPEPKVSLSEPNVNKQFYKTTLSSSAVLTQSPEPSSFYPPSTGANGTHLYNPFQQQSQPQPQSQNQIQNPFIQVPTMIPPQQPLPPSLPSSPQYIPTLSIEQQPFCDKGDEDLHAILVSTVNSMYSWMSNAWMTSTELNHVADTVVNALSKSRIKGNKWNCVAGCGVGLSTKAEKMLRYEVSIRGISFTFIAFKTY